ncbi:MAG: DedA family protein [candidate division SR1 bacterium]|nr:MAG: DedA family protein [candidate division SR1 bacterium]
MNTILSTIKYLIDFIMHIDKHLADLFLNYGMRIYGILFLIIFIETGLVVMPFLPGDSLLFAAGALAGNPENGVSVHLVWLIVFIAAVIGDSVNYEIGKFLGPKVFTGKYKRVKKEHLEKTHHFYEKHGGKTIIYARFIPIVRTFAPFVAGIGKMSYKHFLSFNVIGAALWATLFIYAGYFFGSLEFVQKRFSLIVMAIILLSLLPILIEWIKHKRAKKKQS